MGQYLYSTIFGGMNIHLPAKKCSPGSRVLTHPNRKKPRNPDALEKGAPQLCQCQSAVHCSVQIQQIGRERLERLRGTFWSGIDKEISSVEWPVDQ